MFIESIEIVRYVHCLNVSHKLFCFNDIVGILDYITVKVSKPAAKLQTVNFDPKRRKWEARIVT